MNEQELKLQTERIFRYNKLLEAANSIRENISHIEAGDPDGPRGQGPFTSDTRESRAVHSMNICFTRTQGETASTEMTMHNMGISAPELGRALLSMLRARLATIEEEMRNL